MRCFQMRKNAKWLFRKQQQITVSPRHLRRLFINSIKYKIMLIFFCYFHTENTDAFVALYSTEVAHAHFGSVASSSLPQKVVAEYRLIHMNINTRSKENMMEISWNNMKRLQLCKIMIKLYVKMKLAVLVRSVLLKQSRARKNILKICTIVWQNGRNYSSKLKAMRPF